MPSDTLELGRSAVHQDEPRLQRPVLDPLLVLTLGWMIMLFTGDYAGVSGLRFGVINFIQSLQ